MGVHFALTTQENHMPHAERPAEGPGPQPLDSAAQTHQEADQAAPHQFPEAPEWRLRLAPFVCPSGKHPEPSQQWRQSGACGMRLPEPKLRVAFLHSTRSSARSAECEWAFSCVPAAAYRSERCTVFCVRGMIDHTVSKHNSCMQARSTYHLASLSPCILEPSTSFASRECD